VNLKVRLATQQDTDDLVALTHQLGYELSREDMAEKLSAYGSDDYAVIVAEIQGKAIGFIALHFFERFVLKEKGSQIMALIVDSHYRGKGIGAALIKAGEEAAVERGCYTIDLVSGKRRIPEGTHLFYHRMGYVNEGEMAKLYLRKTLRTNEKIPYINS
jgi:predicted N-acetyltransferase YhbS